MGTADRELVVECSQCGWSPFDEDPPQLVGERCIKCGSSAWIWRRLRGFALAQRQADAAMNDPTAAKRQTPAGKETA